MTTQLTQVLRCDFPGCQAAVNFGFEFVSETRIQASMLGWVTVDGPDPKGVRQFAPYDYCPEHTGENPWAPTTI